VKQMGSPSPAAAPRSRTRGWRTPTGRCRSSPRVQQVPVTNHAAQTSSGLQINMLGEKFRHLGLDRLSQ